ncbi:hypothetical protein E2C01_096475 [Portunus trituberculatus]|uniref:Uncharacterized protein n=1 Tax=Portunus trituberculatus TaxID=210409 RepID=A0A5B7K328_PORTR|nr:hypothetical protein [Portunus trituberculatus]
MMRPKQVLVFLLPSWGGGRHLSGSPEQEGSSGGEDSTGTKAIVAGGHNYSTSMRKEKDTSTRNTQKQSRSLRN